MNDPAARTKDALSMWTIYENPSDYPGKFVVRRCQTTAGRIVFDPSPLAVVDTIHKARGAVHLNMPGLTRLDRHPSDDACIVETWL